MKNNVFIIELHDGNKIITFDKTINIINTTDIVIPLNYHVDFNNDINFILKLNGITIFNSTGNFLLTDTIIFKKIDCMIHIDDTYYVNILNFILILNLECTLKNNNDHICLLDECSFFKIIKEIIFVIEPISNKKRTDGFPECIGRVNENDLPEYELSIINSKKILYTFYDEDNFRCYFVKMQKILDDTYISMINIANIYSLNDNEFDLLYNLCTYFTKYQVTISSHIFNDGYCKYYLDDINFNQQYKDAYFLKTLNDTQYLEFNYANAENIINFLIQKFYRDTI